MKRKIQTCIMVIAFAVLCYSAYRLIMIQMSYSKGDKLYHKVQEEVAEIDMSQVADESLENITKEKDQKNTDREKTEKKVSLSFPKVSIDFSSLEQQNSDVCAWIYLQDSVINYPVVHGTDNEMYLNLSYDKRQSTFGSIFMDVRNKNDFTDKNTIIYGHNMKNGSMFGGLKRYEEESYYNTHKYFYIFTKEKMYRYQVCSFYLTNAGSDVYTTQYDTKKNWTAYEQNILNRSMIRTDVSLDEDDKLITLSTCHGLHTDTRFVVHGKLTAVKEME